MTASKAGETPRTNAAVFHGEYNPTWSESELVVKADFARQLERELAAANARAAETEAKIHTLHLDITGRSQISAILQHRAETAEALAAKWETDCAAQEKLNIEAYANFRKMRQAKEAAELDAGRYRWAKPILSGDSGPEPDRRALELAKGLMEGLTTDEAIDAALRRSAP